VSFYLYPTQSIPHFKQTPVRVLGWLKQLIQDYGLIRWHDEGKKGERMETLGWIEKLEVVEERQGEEF